jgi:hypothetical protein
MQEDINKLIEDKIKQIVPEMLRVQDFTARKLTDTPTDDLAVTNRRYVNLYGSTIGRPSNSVIGQQYFDTTAGMPVFKRNDGKWVNGVGSVV